MRGQKLQLLGPVLVIWEAGEPPRFRTQRTRFLLGYLAAERRSVSRDALTALFWPDEEVSKGKANLRRELHNLGNILPGCWKIDRQSVHFVPHAETEVDIYALSQLEQAGQWREAAGYAVGDFLEGVYPDDRTAFETWLLGERERWRQRAERVLSEAVGEQLSAGDAAGALHFARRLLLLLPWHEAMHRQVMVLLAQQGQRDAALRQYEQCKAVLQAELGVEVSAETRILYERIRETSTFILHNIPAPTTPLIGRDDELALLARWLEGDNVRLITITGAGGMGKTRLALGVAQQLLAGAAHPFADGIYFVSLASLQDPEHINASIAAALKLPFQRHDSRSPRQQLLDYLQGKRMLLILDNFEHLLDGAALLSDIVKVAPGVQVVATSREKLRLQGEQVLRLQGLGYDEAGEQDSDRLSSPAARLFLAAAERVMPGFGRAGVEDVQLRRICQLVEGMPLALELAATWTDTLSLAAIGDGIEAGIDFLEANMRDVPQRHQSMLAVFDTSWQRLSSQEKQVFAGLSVFRGGFDRLAAEAVTGATARTLSRLVNHSLLIYDAAADRYHLHELLRQFAADKLKETRESGPTRSSHSKYYLDLLCRLGENLEGGEHQLEALETINTDIENVRLAWRWALENQAYERLRKGVAVLAQALLQGGHAEEGERLFRRATDLLSSRTDEESKRLLGQIIARQADFARGLLRYEEALHLLERSVEAARHSGAQAEIAFCLRVKGRCLLTLGKVFEAKHALEESLEIATTTGARQTQTHALIGLHDIALLEGKVVEGIALARRLLALCQKTGDKFSLADAVYRLGVNKCYRGDYEEGRRYLEESLTLARQLNDPALISTSQAALALYATRIEGAYDEGRALAEQSLALGRSINHPGYMTRPLIALSDVACWQERYDEALRQAEENLQIMVPTGDTELIHFGRNVLSLALCGLGAHEDAKQQICKALLLTRFNTPEALLLFHLAGMALVLVQEGDHERAIELYALTASYYAHPPAWQTKLPIHVNARNALQAKVSPAIFDRAWKRGEEGDLHEALRSILSTYCF